MNKIIESFLNTHIVEYELSNIKKETAFEHFINRCIINKYSTERFDPNDILTDDGEKGLDGVAIIVNDCVVMTLDEVESIVSDSAALEVKFIFIQSKTSDSFSGSEIGDFIYGAKAFFEESGKRPNTNEKMERLISIKDYLYSHSVDFTYAPIVELYYVCCGKWSEGNGLRNRINTEIQPLIDSPDFSQVKFYPYDVEKIIATYKELKKKVARTFTMEKKVTFPSIEGVTQAYIGFVKCSEFVEILKDSDGKMLTNIFEDNVRDFQGYNYVNQEIQATIKDPIDQARFAILNNGITIVASAIKPIGDNIEIIDYQIVNGCQTSYVLYDNETSIAPNSYIVVKLIEVKDEAISDRVIYTTNRQTEVKSEAFTSTKHFHKRLQDFYNSIPADLRLYYERRSKQYDLVDTISKGKVISLSSQIMSYIACFLNVPHSTHRYYGELLSSYKGKIFLDEDSYEPYYISAYLVYYVESKFRDGTLNSKYKIYKYHIAGAIKSLTVGNQVVFGQSRKQKKEFEKLYALINDSAELGKTLSTAMLCLENALSTCGITNEQYRNKDFTNELDKYVSHYLTAKNSSEFLKLGDIVHCTVTSIDLSFVNVIIKTEDSRNFGSIHISKMSNKYISDLSQEAKIGEIFQARIINDDFYESKFGWHLEKIN